jgi:hypothetical protein
MTSDERSHARQTGVNVLTHRLIGVIAVDIAEIEPPIDETFERTRAVAFDHLQVWVVAAPCQKLSTDIDVGPGIYRDYACTVEQPHFGRNSSIATDFEDRSGRRDLDDLE